MATARERMLELTSLGSPNSARDHFLSITQGTGPGGIVLEYDKIITKVQDSPILASVVETEINVRVMDAVINSTIEDNIITSKITQGDIRASLPLCTPAVNTPSIDVFSDPFSDDFA